MSAAETGTSLTLEQLYEVCGITYATYAAFDEDGGNVVRCRLCKHKSGAHEAGCAVGVFEAALKQAAPTSLSDDALARLEQTTLTVEELQRRINEEIHRHASCQPTSDQRDRAHAEDIEILRLALAALRARGETRGVMAEQLICSAILMPDGYVVRGHRHNDCFRTIDGIPRYPRA